MTERLLAPSHTVAAALRKTMACGKAETVAPGIVRVLADNPKEYTGPGTNTYLVGEDQLWIIDPGPNDRAHVSRVLDAIDGRRVAGVFVTHTHLDHSPAARILCDKIDAPIYGMGPLPEHLLDATDEDIDPDFEPDHLVKDGDRFGEGAMRLLAVHTPGHFPNHLCLFLEEAGLLFTGDHVMGWSTTVVVPPLGHLGEYLTSLNKLDRLNARMMLPSHGEIIDAPRERLNDIRGHRAVRHEQIQDVMARGLTDVEAIVSAIYDELPPRLVEAACGQVQAHIELIGEEGMLLRKTG